MAGVDINRTTSGVAALPPDVSQEIWQKIQSASVVMGLARRVQLSGAGVLWHEILADSEPAFVGETERKPVSNPTIGSKTLKAHKIAVVQTYSDEFRRDLPGLFNALIARLPGTLARTFDMAALHGVGAPVSDFDTLDSATAVSIKNTTAGTVDAYAGFLNALAAVPSLNAWALSAQGRVTALSNRDTAGGAILNPNVLTNGSIGSILGAPVFSSENAYYNGTGPSVLGIAGDWTKAVWGQVEGVSIDISDNPVYASNGTLVTAGWQDNMIGVRAEIHVGFIADDTQFVRLTGDEESS